MTSLMCSAKTLGDQMELKMQCVYQNPKREEEMKGLEKFDKG